MFSILLSLTIWVSLTFVQAQEASTSASTSPKVAEDIEKIEVTGSFIRRTEIEGPSPILVIDKEQIERQGFNSIGEVLARSTANPFGGGPAAGDNIGSSRVNLRGIGSGRTLVLINGQRAPGGGSSFSTGAVNVNFVPISAVERVEILRDGASATYGSDALGGVVNIITKKTLDGFSFANKYDMTNVIGGDKNLTSLAYGKSTAKSRFLTALQLQYTQSSRPANLDWLRGSNTDDARRSTNYTVGTGDAARTFAGPECLEFNASGQCAEVNFKALTNERFGADMVTNYERKLTSNLDFTSTLVAGYVKGGDQFPALLATPRQGIGMSFTGAEAPSRWTALDNYSGGDIRVFHRFDDFVRQTEEQNYYGALILGLKGYTGNSDWQWDVTLNNQINQNELTNTNFATFSGARQALQSGAYDPFDSSQRDTSGIGINGFERNYSTVSWLEAKTSGEMGSALGFDWSAAFGGSAAHFYYSDHQLADVLNYNIMGRGGVAGSGERQLVSVFSEIVGIKDNRFELQLSGRGDFYSDFGNTFNPKLAARYRAASWLTLRGSAGTGFQAPTLQNMNANLEGFLNGITDSKRCNALGGDACNPRTVTAFEAVNPNLKEETSISFNFGAIAEPVKNFSIGVDSWYVKVEDTIGVRYGDILVLDDLGFDTSKYGVTFERRDGEPLGELERIVATRQNVGEQEVTGIDIDLNYRLPTRYGDFRFSNETTYIWNFYQSFYEELGREQTAGRYATPRWRNNFTTGYYKNRYGVQAIARSVADMQTFRRIGGKKIPSPTQYDLQITYQAPWEGRFELGALNLFNIRPRFDRTLNTRINTSIFAPAQTFYLTYRQDFDI